MTRKQIQKLIIQKGLTQTELAKKAGIPYPQILCSMLRGDRWAMAYRLKIAEILGISENEIPRP
jgi:predicted transcriptional regulator